MNRQILTPDVQQFIRDHQDDDISRILFKKSPFEEVSSKELAEQIESRRRCEKKLPLWHNTPGIYYPPKLSVEQASSQLTALYKSKLLSGDSLIDLTGGMGVDTYFFSKRVRHVTYCDKDKELVEIAAYNSGLLGAGNVQYINRDGLDYFKSIGETSDFVFVDPSRRVKSKKVFLLKDCEPDVVANLDLLLSKTRRILIKTSPLLDIQSGIKELKHVSEIHVISIKNDCKELLWIIDPSFSHEPQLNCAAIDESGTRTFSFKPSEEKSLKISSFSPPSDYLYEPDVSLLKAGCFKLITKEFGLEKLHPNTHLYTSAALKEEFIGRKFKVISCTSYKNFCKSASPGQANVITRNFPLTPEEIKKKHSIRDGGLNYLIFTTGPANQLLVIQTDRL